MKNKKYIVIGILLVLIFSVAVFFYTKQDEDNAIGRLVFQTVDMNGDTVDETVFADYELTMVNIWGTYCSPCIEEMPDLEELYGELLAENVNVIGVISDVGYPIRDESVYTESQHIIEETGVTYRNLLPDQVLQSKLLNRTTGVPTTVFVDCEGNVVGDIIVGAQSKLDYRNVIRNLLENEDRNEV